MHHHGALYTLSRSGNVPYGGWSDEGIQRFNKLCHQFQEDRACDKDGQTEKLLLTKLQKSQADVKALQKSKATLDKNTQHAAKKPNQVLHLLASYIGHC